MKAPPRVERAELMDAPGSDPDEIDGTLRHVASATLWMGGVRPLADALRALPVPTRRPIRMLDVGAGNGAVARALVAHLESHGLDVECTLLDQSSDFLANAAGTGYPRIAGDALRLPFDADAFDVSVSVLTLHHFDPDRAIQALHEMGRVSAVGVAISDLRRCLGGLWGARLLAASVWRGNRLTRHDAPVSVLRAYTDSEARALAQRAGLRSVRVRRHLPFRLVLSARTDGASVSDRPPSSPEVRARVS